MKKNQYIPYGKQQILSDDIDAVIGVLKSDYLTQGNCVPNFENSVNEYCNSKYAVAVTSATAALHLACLALELGPDDWLWTSPITFVASSNCALYCGANVDFVDIDPKTFNLCAKALEKKLIQAEKVGKLPKIVIPVHLCGQSCDMKSIHELSVKYNFQIIEDASHAIGGKYGKENIGACQYSDITIFSFHPVKIITTGEGGMAVTNNPKIADTMSLLRSHGITRDKGKMFNEAEGDWYYEQISLGFNYRMTDIQAALGISQLKKIDKFVKKRCEIANRYDELLFDLPLETPFLSDKCYSSFHLYVVQVDEKYNKRSIFEFMRNNNIGVNIHYIPVIIQPFYEKFGYDISLYPNAMNYYKNALSLPMYPTLSEKQQDYVVNTLKSSFLL